MEAQNGRTDVTIQINSLEALERLIGGNSDFEFKIRANIVQDFTKKHLKDLANSELMQATAQAIQTELKKEYLTTVKNGWSETVKFNEKILQELKETLSWTATQQLWKIIPEILEKEINLDKVKKELEKAISRIEAELTDKVLNERLDKLVEERLKKKLGIK